MEFGMSCRIKPKEKYVRISMKEIWRNLDGPPKHKELWSYVVYFEFSRPKVAQEHGQCCFSLSCNLSNFPRLLDFKFVIALYFQFYYSGAGPAFLMRGCPR